MDRPEPGSGRHAVLHDFCMCIPYGAVLLAAGLAMLATGGGAAGGALCLFGGVHTLLAMASLRAWKRGATSAPFTALSAGALAPVVGTTAVVSFHGLAKPRTLPGGAYSPLASFPLRRGCRVCGVARVHTHRAGHPAISGPPAARTGGRAHSLPGVQPGRGRQPAQTPQSSPRCPRNGLSSLLAPRVAIIALPLSAEARLGYLALTGTCCCSTAQQQLQSSCLGETCVAGFACRVKRLWRLASGSISQAVAAERCGCPHRWLV